MRHGIRASTTDLLVAVIAAFCVASCAKHVPPPPPSQPPARSLVVTEGRVSFRTSAYLELHLWLAGAARSSEDVPAELEPARRAYARSLQDDDEDLLLERTTRRLSACSDDPCSSTAVAEEGFGRSFDRALPIFVERAWMPRASAAWTAIEAAHAVLGATGPAADALFARAAGDLGITWPENPAPIDVVSETPPLGRSALVPVALGARGRCFTRPRAPDELPAERVGRARILDCVLIHALLAARGPEHTGAIHRELAVALGAHDGERAWSVLVIHAAAAVVTGWEPRHRSVYARSAEAVEGVMLEWLAKEWRTGTESERPETFAARYAARWREVHATTTK
jgi:hypothetical protein